MLAQEKYFLTEKKYLELKNKKDNPVIAANEENTKTTKSDKKDKKPENALHKQENILLEWLNRL